MIIRWTLAARHDRSEIFDYIAVQNPGAALRVDDVLAAAISRLKDFPHHGKIGAIAGTRELVPHESYRIVYEIDDKTIWILAIVHTSRQWPPTGE